MEKYNTDCFKAYDIRGKVPSQLNEELAYLIGNAFANHLKAKRVAVGFDIRLSSPVLAEQVIRGLNAAGCDADNIGMCGTEEIYHAVSANPDYDGGIMVTASHNPADYNGMKFVQKGSRPVGADSGLADIKQLVADGIIQTAEKSGVSRSASPRNDYLKHLLTYIDPVLLSDLTIVVNAGHGGAGIVIDELEPLLPAKLVKIFNAPDGSFPQGVPNPLLEENRQPTSQAVLENHADLGVAWDGDFDRCFLFDEKGQFVEGYYIVALLAEAFLSKTENNGAKIVHDPRLTWNTIDVVKALGGEPIVSKTGHAFIKEKMREVDAVYGGEMSAHHYFKDFAYCDSGMIPWLLIAELIKKKNKPLSELVAEYQAKYPVSGEINRKVADPKALLQTVHDHYQASAKTIEHLDGLSMSFADWRFNFRMSNTEPVVRLNVEASNDTALMETKTKELLKQIN